MRRQLAASSALSLTLVAALSGCSNSDETPTASDLVAKAKSEATSAKSVDVLVSGDVNGTKTTLQASGTMNGSNQRQVQTQKDAKNEGIVVGKTAYLKGNKAFWTAIGASEANAAKLQDKWWKGETSTGGANPSFDVKSTLNTFFSSEDGKALAAKDATVTKTTTDGQATYTVKPKDSSKSTLIVTRDKKPKIVKITGYATELTKTKATYTFSKWNDVETFKAPSGAKPITSAGLTN